MLLQVCGGAFENHIGVFIKAADSSLTRILQYLVAEIVYKLDVQDRLLRVQKLDSDAVLGIPNTSQLFIQLWFVLGLHMGISMMVVISCKAIVNC